MFVFQGGFRRQLIFFIVIDFLLVSNSIVLVVLSRVNCSVDIGIMFKFYLYLFTFWMESVYRERVLSLCYFGSKVFLSFYILGVCLLGRKSVVLFLGQVMIQGEIIFRRSCFSGLVQCFRQLFLRVWLFVCNGNELFGVKVGRELSRLVCIGISVILIG